MEGYKYEEEKKGEARAGKVALNTNHFGEVGLTVRAIREIFDQADATRKSKTVNIYVSFLQIYNEKVFDLLNNQQFKGKSKV